jgi:hypothetical protein
MPQWVRGPGVGGEETKAVRERERAAAAISSRWRICPAIQKAVVWCARTCHQTVMSCSVTPAVVRGICNVCIRLWRVCHPETGIAQTAVFPHFLLLFPCLLSPRRRLTSLSRHRRAKWWVGSGQFRLMKASRRLRRRRDGRRLWARGWTIQPASLQELLLISVPQRMATAGIGTRLSSSWTRVWTAFFACSWLIDLWRWVLWRFVCIDVLSFRAHFLSTL